MPSSFFDNLIDREYFGMKLGLDKIRKILSRLNHPEKKFRSIRVAGTNGKGSTAIMMARILQAGGLCTGLFTSPHLQRVNERFQINGRLISDARLNELAGAVESVDDPEDHLTFFEFLTAIAFLYFAQEKVDVAIVEVGLGGRLDATNVLRPDVSVITSIAHDHEKHLGKTLEQIAAEKGGIIKEGVPVVCGEMSPPVRRVLEQMAKGTSIQFVDPPKIHADGTFSTGSFNNLWIPTLGQGQVQNAVVAVHAVQTFLKKNRMGSLLPRQVSLTSP